MTCEQVWKVVDKGFLISTAAERVSVSDHMHSCVSCAAKLAANAERERAANPDIDFVEVAKLIDELVVKDREIVDGDA